MLLNNIEISKRKIIIPTDAKNLRASSYDLTIGKILAVDGEEKINIILPPSGVVEVISKERITMPADVTGLAMIKTDLCNKGILALNTGIIGPGYQGPLSTTLLNFSKTAHCLDIDDVFLRLIFLQGKKSDKALPPKVDDAEYLKKKKKSLINFSDKFLNIDILINDLTKPLISNLRTQALALISVLAITLSIFTFLLTFGVNYANRQIWSAEDIRKQNIKQELISELPTLRESDLEAKLRKLEAKIRKLEAR